MSATPQFRWALGATLFGAACLAAPVDRPAPAVRFWTLADATRVVVETTGEFEFTSDRAIQPDRVFFDIKGARVRVPAKGIHTFSVADNLIKQVRVAQTLPGITRIVFDLNATVEFTASQLTNPNRLIVEFRPSATIPTPTITNPQSSATPQEPSPKTAIVVIPEPKLTAPPPALPKERVRIEIVADPTNGTDRAAKLKPPRAATLASRTPSMTRVLGLKIGKIVLDAGHGGHDTGTAGPHGLLEKDLVLDVTKRLGELVEARLGAEVVYTRSDDTFVALETRTQIANQNKADLFLSIHANSSPARSASGVETYYLSFTTSSDAMEVAARENASSQRTVYDLKDLVQKIALQDKVEESREFAARVQKALYAASTRAINHTRNRGVKKAPFVVLIGASMPSVLAEIGFVSNPDDEAQLRKPEVRQKIAIGLFNGLSQYASTLSQFRVAKN